MLIYSVLLIVMMIFRPSGLLGTREFSLWGLISRIKNMIFRTGIMPARRTRRQRCRRAICWRSRIWAYSSAV